MLAIHEAALSWDPRRCEGLVARSEGTAPAAAGVSVVGVFGPLSQRAIRFGQYVYTDGYDALAERFGAALSAEDSGAVVLVFDSPGGSVAGLEENLERMSRMKKKSGKRVIAYVDEFCASAACWLATALADEIVVPKSGQIGSIGVIGAWLDASELYASIGIKLHVHRAPDGKAPGMSAAPVEDVADERMAADVKRASERFFAAVAKVRGLSVSDVRDMDAQMFEGKAAVDAGLADRVGTLEQVMKAADVAAREKLMADENRNELCEALGLDADVSDADLFGAAAKAAHDRDEALTLAAETEAKVAAVEAERDELRGQTRAFEAAQRDELCTKLVASGAMPPAIVWADAEVADDVTKRKPATFLASLSLEELGAMVTKAAAAGASLLPKTDEASTTVGASHLSAVERSKCEAIAARNGVPVDQVIETWIANKQEQANG